MLEENKRLHLENEQLRKRLLASGVLESDGADGVLPAGEARGNLFALYNDGFHVCNTQYGKLRVEGECLFCVAFLNR